jgi:hypothetical protein
MNRATRHLIASLVLAVAALAMAGAQEAPLSSGPYVIQSVDFQIKGVTREFVLRGKVDIPIGKSFPDRASLEAYIADKRQVLLNERVLASVDAGYDAVPNEAGGFDVALHFSTVDSWNIIALPKFQYDSNNGLLLSVRGRDYNFLGSMRTLSLNLNYTFDENSRQGFGASAGFTMPFIALGHEWAISFSDDFAIYPDGTPTTSTTSVGLSVTFKELGFPITLSASQGLSFNPEGLSADPDPYFLSEYASISCDVPTGLSLGENLEVRYAPSASFAYNWAFDGPLGYGGRQGPSLSLSQNLYFGRADWMGNQREGLVASISNSNSFSIPTTTWSCYLDASARAYTNWKEKIGIASRLQAFARLTGSERTSQGGSLRGILDSRIHGVDGVFLNVDLPIKLFDFPTHVIIKKNWLDFEMQASPFLDFGLAKRDGVAISADDFWYAGGLEVMVFPVVMRSFIVRASIGFDLDAVLKNKSLTAASPKDGASPYEIFFGIGLHY